MSEELIADLQILPLFKVEVCRSKDGFNAPAPFQKMESAFKDIIYYYIFFVLYPDERDSWVGLNAKPFPAESLLMCSINVSLAECGIGVLGFVE